MFKVRRKSTGLFASRCNSAIVKWGKGHTYARRKAAEQMADKVARIPRQWSGAPAEDIEVVEIREIVIGEGGVEL